MEGRPARSERTRRARPRDEARDRPRDEEELPDRPDDEEEPGDRPATRRGDRRERPAASRRREPKQIPATAAAEAGMEQIAGLTGKEIEGVIAVQPTDGGWLVGIEVLEDRRVPATSDMLASYEAELDARGRLLGYQRTRRYVRGRADSASPA